MILALLVTVIFFTFKYAHGADEKANEAVGIAKDAQMGVMVNESRIEGLQKDIQRVQTTQEVQNTEVQRKLNILIERKP